MAVRIYYYDPFSSEAKILPNNSFVICNLGELLLYYSSPNVQTEFQDSLS